MTAVRGTGLVLLMLVAVAVPRIAASAVVVAEPTGDANPAFLAELKASLETVAAEAPAALNGELRASATVEVDGVELVVEFVPDDGTATITETRVASMASALAQARAMGKAAIKAFVASPKSETTAQNVDSAIEKVPPPLPQLESFSRRKALWMTAFPTVFLTVAGAGYFSMIALDNLMRPSPFVVGMVAMSVGLVLGPTPGYFYVGRWKHALAMTGLRVSVLGTGFAIYGIWLASAFDAENQNEQCEGTSDSANKCHHDVSNFGLGVALTAVAALVVISFADAFLVGRAADRANAEWREKNKPTVQVAPIAWTSGNGDTTYGLALQGTF